MVKSRCYLVHALAPGGTTPREANDCVNEYVADKRRGLAVWHDHFLQNHGGAIVLEVRSAEEEALLDDAGPLSGWELTIHPLMYALTALGFDALTSFTLERYGGVRLEDLATSEQDDPRYWWRKPNG